MKESRNDRLFTMVSGAIMLFMCVLIIYPLYFMLIASLSSPEYVLSGQVIFWPKGLNLEGYKRILNYDMLWTGYANSMFYSVVGGILSTSLTLMAAYPFSESVLSVCHVFSGRIDSTVHLSESASFAQYLLGFVVRIWYSGDESFDGFVLFSFHLSSQLVRSR